MQYIFGKKKSMGQIYRDNGQVVPVTYIEVVPLTVLALRADASGNSQAILGGEKDAKNISKPQSKAFGELGKFGITMSIDLQGETLNVGDSLTCEAIPVGTLVNATGVSKGKGYQGVVKRHGFAGHPTTHGHKDQVRKSGSIGAGGIQRVFKGMRMAGRTGSDQITVKNLEIIKIDVEKNLVAVKGAIPGAPNSPVTLIGTKGNVWQK